MPKKQTTAGKKARAAAREGEKYTTALRRHRAPVTGLPGLEHWLEQAAPSVSRAAVRDLLAR